MSMNEFKEAMKNEAMKQEFTAFIEDKKPETLEALAEAVVDFAAVKGFSIGKEDVMNNIPDKLKSGKMELSDDVMDNVVGGACCLMDLIIEAIDSIYEEFGWQ